MNLKTSSTNVRSAYVRCLLSCVSSSNAISISSIIPHLLSMVEKSLAQSTQVLFKLFKVLFAFFKVENF